MHRLLRKSEPSLCMPRVPTNTETMVAPPIEMRFNEILERARADLSVKLFGPDFDVLEPMAEKTKTTKTRRRQQAPGHGTLEHFNASLTPF